MASHCPLKTAPTFPFDTLLSKRQLHEGMTFKAVNIHTIEFGPNGLNTANFIDKVMQLAQTDAVKNSGGFMIIRPKNGVNIFTKATNNAPAPKSVWDALPSLTAAAQTNNILYEEQKAAAFTVPLFAWNTDHKQAIIKQNSYKKNKQLRMNTLNKNKKLKAENVFKQHPKHVMRLCHITNNKMDIDIEGEKSENDEHKTGQKRKQNNIFDGAQPPRKRQKIEARNPSPSLLSYGGGNSNNSNNKNTNHNAGFTIGTENEKRYFNCKDLEFYRGFCCMTRTRKAYSTANIQQYIDALPVDGKSPYIEQNIEAKYLTFMKYLYEENSAKYGHIECNDNITCYDGNSPFKPEDLKNYGPFACLHEEECTVGIQTPYIYVGDTHAFFPWHNEDMNFHAVNHLLYGGHKTWFCISPSDYNKVMRYFHKQFKYYYPDCLTPLQHKNCVMDPYIFACLGINVYFIVQKPGDIVIAPPGGLHCGLNESFNIAQSVNFMSYSDKQWTLSLSAMLIQAYNYHDCCNKPSHCNGNNNPNIPCICCNKQCVNPEKRFQCQCKVCDPLKCACDYNIFLDINELAQRVRDSGINVNENIVPKYVINKLDFRAKYGYQYKIYHPRNMPDAEVDNRWTSPPKCYKEYVYPTQDHKDKKFYPAICYNNRIIKRDELLLSYEYQMDFIAFGEYFQICDISQIVYPGYMSPHTWNNAPIQKQHGFYLKNHRIYTKNRGNRVLTKQLKGTPSFDFLKTELNDKSPLIGTEWEHKKVIYAYPPGARKYNLDIRKKKVQNRYEKDKQFKIQQITHEIAVDHNNEDIRYDIEEYVDTASSSSGHSEDKLFESSEDNDGDEDISDHAWKPDTNKWTQTLPEYQYYGLRNTRSRSSRSGKVGCSSKKIVAFDDPLMKKPKKAKKKQTKTKKKRKKRRDQDDDSEDEFIITKKKRGKQELSDSEQTEDEEDGDSDYEMSKRKKKNKKKRKHKKSAKKKSKKDKDCKKKSKSISRVKSKEIKKKCNNNNNLLPLVPDLSTLPAPPIIPRLPLINRNNAIRPIFNPPNIHYQTIQNIQNINNITEINSVNQLNSINNSINQVMNQQFRPQRQAQLRQQQQAQLRQQQTNAMLFSMQKESQWLKNQTQ